MPNYPDLADFLMMYPYHQNYLLAQALNEQTRQGNHCLHFHAYSPAKRHFHLVPIFLYYPQMPPLVQVEKLQLMRIQDYLLQNLIRSLRYSLHLTAAIQRHRSLNTLLYVDPYGINALSIQKYYFMLSPWRITGSNGNKKHYSRKDQVKF